MRRPRDSLGATMADARWRETMVQRQSSATMRTFSCETITPVFGGGVRAGHVDPDLPVRPSALRGQLRYWWRLLNRERHSSSTALFAVERAIWGGLGSDGAIASQVRLRVARVSGVELAPAFHYNKRADGKFPSTPTPAPWIEPYALFSAQGRAAQGGATVEEAPSSLVRPGMTFDLHLDCPAEVWPDVEQALRWWASFGGIGARTRRGLGAVAVAGLPTVSAAEVAEAGGRLVLAREDDDAIGAWKVAVGRLREFRQGVGVGRNPGKSAPNMPGRSRWPEPDEIRRSSGRNAPRHPPQHPVKGFFPRAAFGLPLVFHFKDKGAGDPDDHILEPSGEARRMASPLILRAYPRNGRYAPAALLLPGWRCALRQRLEFEKQSHGGPLATWPEPEDAPTRQAVAAAIEPMAGRGVDDPLSAFLHFFARGGQ